MESIFDYGFCLKSRTLWLMPRHSEDYADNENRIDIHWNMARRFLQGMSLLEDESNNPITIYMSSPGGDWDEGMAIYDAIKHSKSFVTIIAVTRASSMASVILQAADYRVLFPSSGVLIHDGHLGLEGAPRSVARGIREELERVLPTMYGIYLERMLQAYNLMPGADKGYRLKFRTLLNSKLEPHDKKVGALGPQLHHVQALCKSDLYLTPEESVILGLADKIRGGVW